MTEPALLFPGVEALLIDYLGEVLDPVTVHGRIPNPRPDSFVLVRRVGGTRETAVTEAAQLTVEAFALTEPAAEALLQEARAYLFAVAGSILDGVPLGRVVEIAGPGNLPDPTSDQSRYTLTAQVTTRGAVLSA